MPEPFDLSKMLQDIRDDRTPPIHVVDLSGKPNPKNVRVQLNSGVIIKCDIRYQGINPSDGDRLFTIIAEIDWEIYKPKLILVEEMPNDVEFRLRIAGLPDELDAEFCAGLELIPERILKVK